jgi:hypothetical protein
MTFHVNLEDFGLAIIDVIARALEIHKCPRRKYLESSATVLTHNDRETNESNMM